MRPKPMRRASAKKAEALYARNCVDLSRVGGAGRGWGGEDGAGDRRNFRQVRPGEVSGGDAGEGGGGTTIAVGEGES